MDSQVSSLVLVDSNKKDSGGYNRGMNEVRVVQPRTSMEEKYLEVGNGQTKNSLTLNTLNLKAMR